MSPLERFAAIFPGSRRWVFVDAFTTQSSIATLRPAESCHLIAATYRLARLCCSFGFPHLVVGQSSDEFAAQQLLAPACDVFRVPSVEVTDAFGLAQSEGRSCSWSLRLSSPADESLGRFAAILSPLKSRLLVYGAGTRQDIERLLWPLRGSSDEVWFVNDAIRQGIVTPSSSGAIPLAFVEAAHSAWSEAGAR
jgi:hypothetical protein